MTSGEASEVVEAIEKHFSDYLSDWEASFVDDLARRLGAGYALTPRQCEKLDEVFERVSDGGRG